MAGPLIGALRVSLSAETSAFEQGMKRSQRAANQTAGYIRTRFGNVGASLKSSLAGLAGALTVGAIVSAGKAALDYAGSLGELASTIGVTTKDLQEFQYAAGQVGISQDELQAGIQKLTISMGKAELGSKAQVQAFNAIGISVDDLKGKNAGEIFRLMADRLQNVSDRSQRAAVEVAIFGKAGAKLDNLLSGSQGRLDDLSDAAQRLGIVLSDEQIQKADATADKIEALQTVLKAKIAGVVADNSDAILAMANTLADLAGTLATVVGWLAKAQNALGDFAPAVNAALFGIVPIVNLIKSATGSGGPAQTISVKLPAPTIKGKPLIIDPFLAGGGGHKPRSGKDDAERKRQEALRDANQFDQEIRRANIDILQAKKDLAADYIEETSISVEILNAEKAAFEANLQYEVAAKEKTKVQADQLQAAYDAKDALERTALLAKEEQQRSEEVQLLRQHDFDRQRDILEANAQIATTASERRKIELELLRIAYEQKKQALEYVIATSKSIADVEDARRDLANLPKTLAANQQGVLQNTQGPLEQFFSTVPKNAAEAQEAMERLQVIGIDGAINSILALSDGFESFRDTALSAIKQVIAELIRMQLMKLAMNLIGSLGGGGGFSSAGLVSGNMAALGGGGIPLGSSGGGVLPGFASGGSFSIGGRSGIDRNVLALNGLPIARVSYGERLNIGNDNKPMRGGDFHFNVNVNGSMTDADARRTGAQIAAGFNSRIAGARNKGIA